MNSKSELSDSLLRQRRNLLIISVLIIFLQQSEAVIEGLNFAGANLKFNNPQAVYQGLWLLFFYFNLRYFQQYLDDGRRVLNGKWDSIFANNAHHATDAYVRKIAAGSGLEKDIESLPPMVLNKIGFVTWQVAKHSIYWASSDGKRIHFPHDVTLPLKVLWKPIVKTCYELIMLTSAFTDYAIPFLVSAFALGACSYSEWDGSLFALI